MIRSEATTPAASWRAERATGVPRARATALGTARARATAFGAAWVRATAFGAAWARATALGPAWAIATALGSAGAIAAALGCHGPSREMPEAVAVDADPQPGPSVPMPASTARIVVRAPAPGQPSPLNLATLSVGLVPPPGSRPDHLILLMNGAADAGITAAVEASTDEGVLLARLPRFEGPCAPLCPNARYWIQLPDLQGSPALGPESRIEVGDAIDKRPPAILSSSVRADGEHLTIEVVATKPIILRATARSSGIDPFPLELPLIASSTIVAQPRQTVAPDAEYAMRLEGEDLAGNTLGPFELELRTPPRIEITINELVPTPLHAWAHKDGTGVPFGPNAGTGSVTTADQWVELVNHSSRPIDLREADIVLWTLGRAPKQTILAETRDLYFGNGGSRDRWGPGEALVVHPKGTMSSRGFALEVTMRDQRLDRISVGAMPDAIARVTSPPDMVHESLARDAMGRFHWCAPTPGDPLPPRHCQH